MPGGKFCCICKNSYTKDPHVRLHRFPKDKERLEVWLNVFELDGTTVKDHWRVCSRYFPDGDSSKVPSLSLGKRFCSPVKKDSRAKRAMIREDNRSSTPLPTSSVSRSITPAVELEHDLSSVSTLPPAKTTPIRKPYQTDFTVHELSLPSDDSYQLPSQDNVTALKAQLELLQAENASLRKQKELKPVTAFRIEQIQHDDSLVRFYTGFITFQVLIAFFDFLGDVVNRLNYVGSKEGDRTRHRRRKLSPLNALFLTLIKLRLNLRLRDLAFRFGLSVGQTSNIITTWVCFLYQHLSEIDWVPTVMQVKATLPASFKGKCETTFAIIDGSEIFMETPSDLFMQSSTWSEYKHHNTTKFLIACTPNGSICFISQLYVGSISDIELTKQSGFLTKLEDKPGISIMADRGFTIKDILMQLNIHLNIPPFLEGRQQLSEGEVTKGHQILFLKNTC